jgi:hypothetical protein
MNPFRSLPHPAKGLEPVKEVYLEKLMDLTIIENLSFTLVKMLNPVETRVPDLLRKTLLYLATLYVSHKCTRSLLSADILLKRVRHKLYTALSHPLMGSLVVYPKNQVSTSIFIKEEVAERRMM